MYERLVEKLERTTSIKWFQGHGVEEGWITEAEAELGYSLPQSYLWWLRHYGNGRLDGGSILSLTPPEFRDIADDDILYIHRLNLADEDWVEQFPGRLDLFVPDSDELYFFDTSFVNDQQEFNVMRYDLMNGIIEVYAPTFAEFLEQLIDQWG
ncbi:SMI1/KNR4 family protein [Paenibacillus paeoniae]|uniref:SMI1/KNR4 family protein n=1 Tax=Paenibacillus paeoniae TaxID=2292705 RepID=A0A371PLC7_9BACL|nr:SMI1/KNR4 family protein [Paenibacillus paeoniae]REK76785.1 SMI1/KNR4 family protein [Paenibacillus paeoniae]